MRIGDPVVRRFAARIEYDASGRMIEPELISGRVEYIHPKGRYHMVRFSMPGGTVRECYTGTD